MTEEAMSRVAVLAANAAYADGRTDLFEPIEQLLREFNADGSPLVRKLHFMTMRQLLAIAMGAPVESALSSDRLLSNDDQLICRTFLRAVSDSGRLGTMSKFRESISLSDFRDAVLSAGRAYFKTEWSNRVKLLTKDASIADGLLLDYALQDEDASLDGLPTSVRRYVRKARRSTPAPTKLSDLVRLNWLPLCLWTVEAVDRAPIFHDALSRTPGFESTTLDQARKAINNCSRFGLYKSKNAKGYRSNDGTIMLGIGGL